jgi:hypothetical protein
MAGGLRPSWHIMVTIEQCILGRRVASLSAQRMDVRAALHFALGCE